MKSRMKRLVALGLVILIGCNGGLMIVNAKDTSSAVNENIELSVEIEETESEEVFEQSGEIDVPIENAETYSTVSEEQIVDGWSSDGLYYYVNGEVVKGIFEIQGNLYYFNENTGMLNKKAQWIEKEGKRYFCNEQGILYRNQFIKFGDTYYYMGSDGSVQTGIVMSNDGCLYYMGEDGNLQKKAQWIEKEGKRYFCNEQGILYCNRFIKFGDIYYYMGSDGSVQTGIVKASDGHLYYLGEDGILQKKAQWIEKEGKRYFCDEQGILYQNRVITFGDIWYCMGADGSVQYGIVKVGGKYYNTDKNTGIVIKKTGWIEENGKRYFSKADGSLYQNQFIKFGTIYYYCGSDAAIVKNAEQAVDGVLYRFDENGVMLKEGGWGEYNGNKYYKNPETGFPYKKQWVTFGKIWYYANSQGFMVSGWQTIDGKRYYFYSDTKYMARNTTMNGIRIDPYGVADSVYNYAEKVLDKVGWNLRAAFDWAQLPYKSVSNSPAPGSAYFAEYGFKYGCGDCYVMASTFYYMARLMGYDAHQVIGFVNTTKGREDHSWVEIDINGVVYVFDPSFEHGSGRNGYYFTYGTPGTWRYMEVKRIN